MSLRTAVLLCLAYTSGCQCFTKDESSGCTETNEHSPTLFTWAVGTEKKDKGEKDGQDGDAGNKASEGNDPRSKPLQSDRPDFTEASTTVGKGVIQFEGGYTYTGDHANNTTTSSHTYPQALFRIGMFADWFELRIGQNFANNHSTGEVNEQINGAEDMYLGVKLALTEQKQFLPEMAVILQTTIPTGQGELSANRTLPGINLLYGWELIKEKLEMGGSIQVNKTVEDDGHSYSEFAASLTVGYSLTEKIGAFTECYGICPSGAVSPSIKPQYYFDGGFTYKLTNDIQFDINAGVGLNRYADDYFIGSGIVLRY